VYEPDLLLLDEPFSNLDAKLREQMRIEVKLLQRRLGITVLFVTHDQIEALSLSDRIAVMQRGRVEQVGPPRSLYDQPASAFVRDFLGQTVILRGRLGGAVEGRGDRPPGCIRVELNGPLAGHTLEGRAAPSVTLIPGAEAHVAIRPEDIDVGSDDRPRGEENALTGVIDTLLFVGDRYEARVALGGEQSILPPRARDWREGQRSARLPARGAYGRPERANSAGAGHGSMGGAVFSPSWRSASSFPWCSS
jgi:ABC-type Fe3+/spermidine/putrescine transport system ATPase subunit